MFPPYPRRGFCWRSAKRPLRLAATVTYRRFWYGKFAPDISLATMLRSFHLTSVSLLYVRSGVCGVLSHVIPCWPWYVPLSSARWITAIQFSPACPGIFMIGCSQFSTPPPAWSSRPGGTTTSRSLKMAPFDRLYTTFYWSAIVSIAVCCTIFNLFKFNNHDLEKVTEGHSNWYNSKAKVLFPIRLIAFHSK